MSCGRKSIAGVREIRSRSNAQVSPIFMSALTITIALGALTQLGVAYPHYAVTRGWPIGSFAAKDGWYIYHGLATLGLIWISWSLGGVLWIGMLIVGSFVGAFVLMHLFFSWSQTVSLFSLPLTIIWYIAALGQACGADGCAPLISWGR
jgi:hypothetical protein